MARGFVCLAAVVDWFNRRVLAWRVPITLTADFCVEALEEVLRRHGKPEICNVDQGSQSTSLDFTRVLKDAGIQSNIPPGTSPRDALPVRGGKGARRDDVFVERLWRSVKCEEVCLRACAGVSEARTSIGGCLGFYSGERPHSSLRGKTPDRAYFNQPTPIRTAA